MTTTERLTLSRIAPEDVDDLVAMLLNPALYHHIGDAPASAAQARERIERWLRGSADPEVLWINHVARRRADGRLVGLAQATESRDACEIAYLVDPSAQRRGFGREMMSEFCAELARTVKPATLTAHIKPGHAASEGVAKALGLAPTTEHVDGERVWRATPSGSLFT